MTDGRLERLGADEARARLAPGMPQRFAELSVFQIALKNPVVAEAMTSLLVALLENGRLDPRLRELAIMRIGWTTNSVSVASKWPISGPASWWPWGSPPVRPCWPRFSPSTTSRRTTAS